MISLNNLARTMTIVAHDVLMIPCAWLLSNWLLTGQQALTMPLLSQILWQLPNIILLQIPFFWIFGLYRGMWRFASLPDLVRIIKACATGTGFVYYFLFLHGPAAIPSLPLSILYCITLIFLLGGSRLCYRIFRDYRYSFHPKERVIILGAGTAGETLARSILRSGESGYKIVAFLDDDKKKCNREIQGIPVLGRIDNLPNIVSKHQIEKAFIAIPSISTSSLRELVNLCQLSKIPCLTLPISTKTSLRSINTEALRNITLEDIIGRAEINISPDSLKTQIKNKVILVTGGGGSIGSELCRQIAELKPAALIIVDNSEFNLFSIDAELKTNFPFITLHSVLGSITNTALMESTFSQHQPEIVFHAAAYKHVSLLEQQSIVAIENNVFGTKQIAELAIKHEVQKFVLISTDKAVNPTSVMGATKRMAELFCQNLPSKGKTCFVTVRFGNVLNSAGSVVPLFKKQIEDGGPVTVTHPDIVRYFMTIPEAANLILHASSIGAGGEIFVLDMGEPIKIAYLAEKMIQLANKKIEIIYTGLKTGEKLYEELFYATEKSLPTSHNKIFKAQCQPMHFETLTSSLENLKQACQEYNQEKINRILKEIIPEYTLAIEKNPVENNSQNDDSAYRELVKELAPIHQVI